MQVKPSRGVAGFVACARRIFRHGLFEISRAHPISFLRADIASRRIVSCAETMAARDGYWLECAGIVLVRQRPGSAKGVLFATIEDETCIANVVCWAKTFEKYRRVLLSSAMLGIRGRVQREGEVVHLVAHHLTDLTPLLASVGHRGGRRPAPDGAAGASPARNLGSSYGHIREVRVLTRDFR